jgi:uncharacterized phage protein (TIGR01671 family)
MNDKIQFRAWDEKQKYMAYQGDPHLETLQSFIHHYGDKELMQWTGVCDKNGKKIYVGDVVECLDYDNAIDKVYNRNAMILRGVVEYRAPRFIAIRRGKAMNISLDCNDLEVIGNIKQNPEPNNA